MNILVHLTITQFLFLNILSTSKIIPQILHKEKMFPLCLTVYGVRLSERLTLSKCQWKNGISQQAHTKYDRAK